VPVSVLAQAFQPKPVQAMANKEMIKNKRLEKKLKSVGFAGM
jgi:hypothetical protein